MTRLILMMGTCTLFLSCQGQPGPGKILLSPIVGQKATMLPRAIWSIYQDEHNHYWFGSNGAGVYRFDGKDLVQFTRKDGLADDQVRRIQADRSGHMYFDTPGGVSRFDGRSFTTLKPVVSKGNEWRSDHGDLWFKLSGDTNGVYRYDGTTLFHLEFPEADPGEGSGERRYSHYGVYSIYKDRSGAMWFGTLSAGVYRYDGRTLLHIAEREFATLEDGRSPGVRAIAEDKSGSFWLSNILSRYRVHRSDAGISYEKTEGVPAAERAGKVDLPYFLAAVTDDRDGDLWMASYNEGVWRYDGSRLTRYAPKDGDTDVLICTIYKDRQGTLWLGTDNAGLYRFNGRDFERSDVPAGQNQVIRDKGKLPR